MEFGPLPPPWGPEQAQALSQSLRQADANRIWDLVIIGAGITGAGIARDAAMRGLQTLVVDRNDLASGTSSRSSRLVHGGVRYLEHGDFSLVHEALRERSVLYKIAPHLVRPERFMFLSYRGDRLGTFRLRAGLALYDALNRFRGNGHRFLSVESIHDQEPEITSKDLRGALEYEDALTDDARLTLATLQSARQHGAEVLTHRTVRRVHHDLGRDLHLVELEDGITIQARQAVCALGPWTTPALMGDVARGLLATSKGIHLVFLSRDLPIRRPIVIQATDRRRILFVIPWENRTYVGTTDDPYEGEPSAAQVEKNEAISLLEEIARIFPRADLRPEKIVGAWVGVRPLVRQHSGQHETTRISRSHRILERDDGVLAIVGGKLTTFRSMAEEVLERAWPRIARLNPELSHSRPECVTKDHPLIEGPVLDENERHNKLLVNLYQRHGPFARSIATKVAQQPSLAEPIIADLPYCWIEVDHAIHYEGCRHLDDVLRRRIPLALLAPQNHDQVFRQIASELVHAWGGGSADINYELERFRSLCPQKLAD